MQGLYFRQSLRRGSKFPNSSKSPLPFSRVEEDSSWQLRGGDCTAAGRGRGLRAAPRSPRFSERCAHLHCLGIGLSLQMRPCPRGAAGPGAARNHRGAGLAGLGRPPGPGRRPRRAPRGGGPRSRASQSGWARAAGAAMTRGHRTRAGMTRAPCGGRRARRGAGGARPKRPSGGASAPDPAAGGRGGAGALPSLCAAPSALVRVRSKQLASGPQALDLVPDAFFVRVRLEETGEMFRVADCRSDMTVRELKEDLDLMVGIPFNLQRLQYLDQGDLMDDTTLKFHDVVPGGVLSLCVWHYDGWTDLVVAAVEGDPSKLACLGTTEDSFYRTANSERLEGAEWKQWTSQRAFVALYITSHRGHSEAVRYLLEHGASCLSRSPVGRTALHVAAAMGCLDCISLLLEHGASIHDRDARGETPITVARRLHRKLSMRRMFLLYWMAQSGAKGPSELILKKFFRQAVLG
ncbi:ankyrin repeat domain-containing protein 60 [Erethizon dorsatum]